jgi:transcriptional regulator with XRE-family HTH domain
MRAEINIDILKKEMMTLCLSQLELAVLCGVERSTISKLFKSQTITPNLLKRISEALNISPERILK